MAGTDAQTNDIRELIKSNKKRFWRLLEVEVIQGPDVPLARIIEKYKLNPDTVYKYAKRHGWTDKKTVYRKAMLSKKSAQPDHREVFRDFLSRQISWLAWRVERILEKEREQIQRTISGNLLVLKDKDGNPIKDSNGAYKTEEPLEDDVSLLSSRVSLLSAIQNLGVAAFGPAPPVEPPNLIFEAVIKEQRVSYITVNEIGEELPPIEVEVPAGMTVSDVTGRPQE